MIQNAKLNGASYICAVSTQSELCRSLGADTVLDYRKTKWWEPSNYHAPKGRFDVVIDLVNGDNWTCGGCSGKAVKRKGTYVALMPNVETEITARSFLDVIPLMFSMLGRILYSRLNPFVPKWVTPEALKLEDGDLTAVLEDVATGRIQPILDPVSPLPFTEDGVRKGMEVQK